jgi:NADH:ubiquinone oxidoreductase subunit 3 (subunit A)
MPGANFIVFFVAILLLSLILFYLTSLYALSNTKNNRLKLFRSFYECGFSITPDNYQPINLQFQTLLLVFLIYDMEIILFTPLLLNLTYLPYLTLLY